MNSEWRSRQPRRLALVDALVVVWAMAGALILRFGTPLGQDFIQTEEKPYIVVSVVMSVCWWIALGLSGSRDITILGYGSEEFKRILTASFWLFGVVAVLSYAFQLDIARGYIGLALPAGLLSLFAARWLLRTRLRVDRSLGDSCSSVLIIGGHHGADHLARALSSQPMAGYRPMAIYVPDDHVQTLAQQRDGLPVLRGGTDLESILETIQRYSPDAVALSSGVPIPPMTIRRLGWALADMNVKMILAPALTDIAGPRIHTQPVAGLPLIHVSTPNLGSAQRILKRVFDLAGALSLLIALSPLFAVVTVIIRLDSPGPIFFRQERVGAAGRRFSMYKFRSMVADAESRLENLRGANDGNGVLFKMRTDPRVTKSGSFLRRYSLDELPQLLNVVNGTMSLVGPRPPLPAEVEAYESHVHRRLMVRPGLTGLWQVSGRSLLSWDDSVRLDLYYVENWSLAGDMAILLRTVRAVLSKHGAY